VVDEVTLGDGPVDLLGGRVSAQPQLTITTVISTAGRVRNRRTLSFTATSWQGRFSGDVSTPYRLLGPREISGRAMADSTFDRALRVAHWVYLVAQLTPGVVLLGISGFGYLQFGAEQPVAGLAMFFLPVVVLGASGWHMRRSWNRPAGWTLGAAHVGAVLGLAVGAITAILLAGAGVPAPVAVFGFIAAGFGGGFVVWWPVWLVKRRLLFGTDPVTLAGSVLAVPFRVRRYVGITLEVGTTTVDLTGRYQGYRKSVLSRVYRRSLPLTAISAGVGELTGRQQVPVPVARYDGMIWASPGSVLYITQGHGGERWIVPLDDVHTAAEVIRLRKHGGMQSRPHRRRR
jgi:hypothetical protein